MQDRKSVLEYINYEYDNSMNTYIWIHDWDRAQDMKDMFYENAISRVLAHPIVGTLARAPGPRNLVVTVLF